MSISDNLIPSFVTMGTREYSGVLYIAIALWELKKKPNSCTCFMLSVTFAPAAPLHTWECIDKCVPMWYTDWLVLMMWLCLPWQPKQNPCSVLQLGHGEQVRESSTHPRRFLFKLPSGDKHKLGFMVGCSFFLLPKMNRCCRHSKALQNLNSERACLSCT